MKRYLLFAGFHYYPNGGWDDFLDGFESPEDALAAVATLSRDWWHVVDSKEQRVVRSGVKHD